MCMEQSLLVTFTLTQVVNCTTDVSSSALTVAVTTEAGSVLNMSRRHCHLTCCCLSFVGSCWMKYMVMI